MRYGLGYMGSKNQIAEKLIAQLPKAEYFVDLFAGGCAMTHCAMLSGKYKKFIANDLGKAPQLFKDAIDGKFANETRWISREDFFALKDSEPYVKYCWSFGNRGITYLYSKEIEEYKKAFHYAVVFEDYEPMKKLTGWDFSDLSKYKTVNERRLAVRQKLAEMPNVVKRGSHYYATKYAFECAKGGEQIDQLESLQRLQRLQSLESLQRLESLQVFQKDYREVELPDDCVIYCDIPYRDTAKYDFEFDYDAFYEWAGKQKNIFISEYSMPDELFDCVYSAEKNSLFNTTDNRTKKMECLYVPKGAKSERYIDALFWYDEVAKEYKYA